MIAYEFYLRDPIKGNKLVGILPEKRKDPARITQKSIMNWVEKVFSNGLNDKDIYFIQVNDLIGASVQMRRVFESIQENIRELENQIKRAVIMVDGYKIILDELHSASKKHGGHGLKEATEVFERDLIQGAITRSKGNITQASVQLGLSRPGLYDLIKKLRIEIEKG